MVPVMLLDVTCAKETTAVNREMIKRSKCFLMFVFFVNC